MSDQKIDIGSGGKALTAAINKTLSEFSVGVSEELDLAINEVSKEAVKRLKETSPKGRGRGYYAKSWTMKKTKKRLYVESIVYSKKYQLTHLLENGHPIVRNGKVVGRAKPQPHIGKVNDYVQEEIMKILERKL